MIFVRSLIFSLVMLVCTIVMGILGLPLLFTPSHWVNEYAELWCRCILYFARIICGIHYTVDGIKYIPQQASIIASKHQSLWETVAFFYLLPNPTFVLKRELLWVPIFGWYLWRTRRIISIDRGLGVTSVRKMIRQAVVHFNLGRSIIIFPEGTRTAIGKHSPYQSSGIQALLKVGKYPIIPVSLNSGYFWGKKQFLKRPGCITLKFHPPLEYIDSKAQLMKKLQQTIESGCNQINKKNSVS